MNGAPKGCIPLVKTPGFFAASAVASVMEVSGKYTEPLLSEIFPNGRGVLVQVGKETFYFEMSVQQFAARMVEALAELDPPKSGLCDSSLADGRRCALPSAHQGAHFYVFRERGSEV